MSNYSVQTVETADDAAKEQLATLRQVLGFVPNVAGVMANSVPLLHSFFAAFGSFRGEGTFTPAERQVLLLTNAVTNGCAWAVAFHSYESLQDGVSAADVEAIRRGELPGDPRLAALSALTRSLIEKRGQIDTGGFDKREVLEVVCGVAISTMTNYSGNVARPPLEPVIQAFAWQPAGA